MASSLTKRRISFIKYTANVEVKDGHLKANRCNCTFCTKFTTSNHSIPNPAEDFTLLSPKSRDELGDYAPRMKTLHRYFCKTCGAHVWIEGFFEVGGHKHEAFMLNVSSIDQPQEGLDLSQVKLMYFDMLHDNINGGLKETPWPNGLI